MKIRNAEIPDAEAIHSLITHYGELDKMLFRSLADIYENLQAFKVAEVDGKVVGCCALQIVWKNLAEIKSLAIEADSAGKGIGKALVEAAIGWAKELHLPKIFALTLEKGFFDKLGFIQVEKDVLPMKVWSDCARCSKQENCDEIAVLLEL